MVRGQQQAPGPSWHDEEGAPGWAGLGCVARSGSGGRCVGDGSGWEEGTGGQERLWGSLALEANSHALCSSQGRGMAAVGSPEK